MFSLKNNKSPSESFLSKFSLEDNQSFKGLSGAIAPLLLAKLSTLGGVTLLIVQTPRRAADLAAQVRTWLPQSSNSVSCFISERNSIYDQTSTSQEIIQGRLKSIAMGIRGGGLVIANAQAVIERFYKPKDWAKNCFKVKVGSDISRTEVINKLVSSGYKRAHIVEEPGTFTVRGSLIDAFSTAAENPVRLDFFGDELETIKYFSVTTQRTIDKIKSATFIPTCEFIVDEKTKESIYEATLNGISNLDAKKAAILERKLEHFTTRADSRDFRELIPFFNKPDGMLWEYWKDFRIVVEESDNLAETFENFISNQHTKFRIESDITPLLPPDRYYHLPETVLDRLELIGFSNFSRFGREENPFLKEVSHHGSPTDPSRETIINELRKLVRKNWAIAIVINNNSRFHNLKGLLGERKIPIHNSVKPFSLKYGSVSFIKGNCGKGFKDKDSRLAVFSEEDIYISVAKEEKKRNHATQEEVLAISQMVPGDIVVHSDHGVAEFRGIKTMKAGGNTREYILLQYAGSDRLYVPTDQVQKVTKYVGMEGYSPRIHSLSSKVWGNQKKRVTKNVEAVARELIELYAKRLTTRGFAFSPDCDLQRQMENRFPFVETPDQMKTINDTKKDMESPTPMDRLICGDVGYGKTEVALRCAFKAVCSGKQVALLSPTTLLALQHFKTFKDRLNGLPVSVDMISRLRTVKEQKETLAKLKNGTLDILIGTHRIVSNDVFFKDLGLLIVDEEQRFGVKHKEKLKKLKKSVDVMTLTATPIPRTLQMSMSGIRQISVINTPPQDRLPVQTYVAPFEAAWVKRAIINELKRGGQVYYVFNRVEKIQAKLAFLQDLVPEARITIAHGQMSEQKVEKTMLEFIDQKHDVLIATTIIESGLDIPNVNTLIVDKAELLGLSQMYQLRGRVGRSDRQASAYFFYSKGKKLTKEAKERLETIEEHTSLGSGFKIALKDLQIRGAGNILGEAQSGHIASIGFNLYMEILEEAVAALKSNSEIKRKIDVTIEIPVTAYFPQTYISDEEIRVEIYARLSRCSALDAVELIHSECEDRFGVVPEDSEGLFKISRLRILASNSGIKKVSKIINHLRFEFASKKRPDAVKLLESSNKIVKQIYFEAADPNAIQLELQDNETNSVFEQAEAMLKVLASVTEGNNGI